MYPALSIQTLNFRYPGHNNALLTGLNLRVNSGECAGILGANGSGKSTLVSLIAGLAQSFGDGEFRGEIRRGQNERPPLTVLQDPDGQILCERVGNELEFFHTHAERGQNRPNVEEAISACGLENLRGHYVYQLSYGQKQRVVLASALLCANPGLIVLDEPFAHLDEVGLKSPIRRLESLKNSGSAIVLVGHDLARVASLIDRWYLLAGGRLKPLPHPPAPTNPGPPPPPRPLTRPDLLFSARGITCRDSRGKTIFQPFNQDFHRGRIYGLTGTNGCGKSSLATALAGITEFADGNLYSGTRPLRATARRRTIRIVNQNPFRHLLYRTGEQNIQSARRRPGPKEADISAAKLLSFSKLLSRDVVSLSRGEALRLSLLCALAGNPELLILDEALVGLDPGGVDVFLELLFAIRDQGKCVLLISHLPELLDRVCDIHCRPLESQPEFQPGTTKP